MVRRIPRATYRLQFHRGFTFDAAAALVPYLAELGVSHCYASPYLKARSGSPHGYDIVDHSAINPEIGSERSFLRFLEALRRHGMGQILDLVPNHMGVGGDDNAWWLDVLENGPASVYAEFFDIDWFPNKEELRGKVLVPVLGNHYGSVLESGELRLAFDAPRGEFSIWYYNHRFPLEPRTYPQVLAAGLERLSERLGAEDPDLLEFQSLITSFGHLPSRWDTTPEQLAERRRDKEVHKRHLAELCAKRRALLDFVEDNVAAVNGNGGEPDSFDALHELVEQQVYRLAYWQVASDEINYRRFFDINDLAGLRMEEPEVFDATHRLVLQLVSEGRLDGLRLDHPDGLYDPPAYYTRLEQAVHAALPDPKKPLDGRAMDNFYVVVEKILASYERLPEEWPVHGTTGYDFTNLVGGLFVDGDAQVEMERIYTRFVGERQDFDQLLYQSKKLVIEVQLSSELTVLANMMDDIAQRDRHTRDFTLNGFRSALTLLVASFPVYRTYIGEQRVTEEDRRYVEWAVAWAKKQSPAADVSIFDFIRTILLDDVCHPDPLRRGLATRFAMKLQQYTAPVMAKGLEDTSFYRYQRLTSLNEVGGDPRRFGTSLSAFHHANQERLRLWPHSMLSTSTHDSKRSEDVRARINVLSEIPEQWRIQLQRWTRLARSKKLQVDGQPAPSRNDEYLLYQTLIGAWPLESLDERALGVFRERIKAYMLKAVKEAKVHTSWVNPNAAYEEAVCHFVEALLSPSSQNAFLAAFLPFQKRLARFGLLNSLSQTLLKLTAPGVPDLYQGSELWDFSLVDPDNRRPVDYGRRRELLRGIIAAVRRGERAALARELAANLEDGRARLYLIWTLLHLRQEMPEQFFSGDYLPLGVEGEHAAHVCAYARRHEGRHILVIATRCHVRLLHGEPGTPLGELWGDTRIERPTHAAARFRNLFTDETLECRTGEGIALAAALSEFPVAVLIESS